MQNGKKPVPLNLASSPDQAVKLDMVSGQCPLSVLNILVLKLLIKVSLIKLMHCPIPYFFHVILYDGQ